MSNFLPFSYLNAFQSQTAPNNFMGFASVRDSKENLFASNLMPLPPKFSFQDRTGRINWRQLMNVDLDKITKEVDLKQLEILLQNITFANLDKDDLERLGDSHFIKLFRLTQYSIEYLLYTQNYLESLTKGLDVEYKQNYEKTVKLEEMIRKYQQELKVIRNELKIKQKTLSTYEYLMKLPAEQEQDVIKCRHCHKFFLSKNYLQRHYQRHHPEFDFYREFSDPGMAAIDERVQQLQEQSVKQHKINQEELYDKIKGELFSTLSESFKKIEQEITVIKTKQNYGQIQEMLQTMEHKNEEEQRRIQESLQKPAKMLEELKGRWADMFSQQNQTMRDIIQVSVNEAIQKRKDERDKRKQNKSGDLSSDGTAEKEKAKLTALYNKKIKELDDQFMINLREKEELQKQIEDYQKLLQEKSMNEEKLLQIKTEEELKRKAIEQQKIEMEKMLQLKEEEKLRLLEEEEKKRKEIEEEARKIVEEQRKAALSQRRIKEEEEKAKQLKMKQEQDEMDKLQKEKKEKEEKERIQKENEEAEKLAQAEKDAQEKAALAEKERKLKEQKEKQIEEERKKKMIEEEQKKKKQQEQQQQQQKTETVIVEEDVEEEIDDIEEEQKQKQLIQAKKKASIEEEKKFDKNELKGILRRQIEQDNKYEGTMANLKSFFNHSRKEVEQKRDTIMTENYISQEQILRQEFDSLKIVPSQQQAQINSKRADLEKVHEQIKSLNKNQLDKLNGSLTKRISDQTYNKYTALIDSFIRNTLK